MTHLYIYHTTQAERHGSRIRPPAWNYLPDSCRMPLLPFYPFRRYKNTLRAARLETDAGRAAGSAKDLTDNWSKTE